MTGAPGWLCCRLDRCCRKRRPHSGEESVLGRGRQSFTICRFFPRTFEMNFLKYKTNNTYNTNTLSLEEYHRICPSVTSFVAHEARPSDAVLRTGAQLVSKSAVLRSAADAAGRGCAISVSGPFCSMYNI